MIKSTLQEWNLTPEQQVCLTTDSGSNIIAAARQSNLVRHNLHLAVSNTRCSRAIGVAHKMLINI